MARRSFVAGRAELINQGFRPGRIDSWLTSGRMHRLFHGVYSYGRDIESREAAFRAALLAAGPGSALTGPSACEVWGIITPRTRIPRLIEVATGCRKATTHAGLSPALSRTRVRVVRRRLEPGDIRKVNGTDVLRPGLALIDFAVNASDRDVRFAFLEASRLGHLDRREVAFCFRRMVGRRGAKKLRRCLALWVPELRRVRSLFEGRVWLAWIERGLPLPKINARVFGYEVDAYWPEQRLVLELDGDAFHSDRAQKSIDRDKQRDLESNGLVVLRTTSGAFDRNPDAELDRIAARLNAA